MSDIQPRIDRPKAGCVFGRLKLLRKSKDPKFRVFWACLCLCGQEKTVQESLLISGNTQSCGCLHKEQNRSRAKHREVETRLYKIWKGMRQRCFNSKNQAFAYYGGRGITVCDEWREFLPFKNWATKEGYAGHLTLDRKNNNGNYAPSNCQWASRKEQMLNRRNNFVVTAFGETKIAEQWARDERCQVSEQTIAKRIRAGMEPELALTMISSRGRRRRDR